jgi:NADP-dependent 3-hydroxy acid dehydrogenase YdfG
MLNLKDKTVLITGASSGIGEACAKAFAREVSKLILIGRRTKLLKKLSDDLAAQFDIKALTVSLDIRDKNQVKKTIENLPEQYRSIDILINNAGLARGVTKIQDGSLDDWEEMIDTNFKGLLYITRAVIPGMIKRGGGDIVNIGSIAGGQVYPGGNVYCATKHAVNAITKGLRIDLVDTPIRVSAVDPGMVETEFSIVRHRGDKDSADAVYKGMSPLHAEDIAEAVFFVVSRPVHVQIAEMLILPADQASAMVVHRKLSLGH